MKNVINIGVIGLGGRGAGLMKACLLPRDDVAVAAISDRYEDRIERAAGIIAAAGKPAPVRAADYKDVLSMPSLDAVLITTGWTMHIDIACEAMRAGKYAAIEVGGAYSIDDCWRLVRTYEQTGTPCMLLENCCYGRYELMTLNMVRQGVLGEVVHCQGGYRHDLRHEIAYGTENRHYRYEQYLNRNCDNYPTHELGPIANVLDINRGNRMLSLVSVASKAAGMKTFFEKHKPGSGAPRFAQADTVSTIIKCARGETIAITMDTTLPRAYTRGFQVQGTRGMYSEDNNSVFLDDEHGAFEFNWRGLWGYAEKYLEKYEHPIWGRYIKEGVKGDHDGIDWLVLSAFIKAAREGGPVPIDVYDTAAWMSISCLSENSVATGGAPVAIPDFTNGKWIGRKAWEG